MVFRPSICLGTVGKGDSIPKMHNVSGQVSMKGSVSLWGSCSHCGRLTPSIAKKIFHVSKKFKIIINIFYI